MTGDRDTFDRFQPRDRGRFGDNETAVARKAAPAAVTVKVIFVTTARSGNAIGVAPLSGYIGPLIYLPTSQIKYEPKEPQNGERIAVEMPEWLAKEKGLI